MEPPMSLPIEEIITSLSDPDKSLANSKLAQLSNLSPEELEPLEQAWENIEPKQRRQFMSRLVELAEDNIELNFDSIFKSRLKDSDDEVRSIAIEGLWESEETCLIDPFIALLEKDSSEKVQAVAATALGKFALLAELKKLRTSHKSKISKALLAIITTESKPLEVKRRALEAAAPLSLPQMKQAIMEAYQSTNPGLKISALFAMGRSCNRSWLPILLRELTGSDAEMRYEAAGACGELGEKEAVPYLIELVSDPDVEVQLAAVRALGKIGASEAKGCLEQCLDNPNETVQHAAEQALYELEGGEEPLSFRF
jgi:HEAT repeat protein